MPVTALEVLDDVVKIGLGAAIGLVGAFITRKHDREKERARRRSDAIERISADFEAAHAVVTEYYGFMQAGFIDPKLRTVFESRLSELRINKFLPALQALHGLEGRLMLLGLPESAKAMQAYIMLVIEYQNEAHECLTKGQPDRIAKLPLFGGRLYEHRTALFRSLSTTYAN